MSDMPHLLDHGLNPKATDALMRDLLGVDLATARAALHLAEDFSRDVWHDTHRTSMSLSRRVSRYREARLNSDG